MSEVKEFKKFSELPKEERDRILKRAHRGWMVTIWDIPEDPTAWKTMMSKEILNQRITCVFWQIEKAPTTGKLHAQTAVICEPMKITQVMKIFNLTNQNPKGWAEPMGWWNEKGWVNWQAALNYCSKPDTRMAGPWAIGTLPGKSSKNGSEGTAPAAGSKSTSSTGANVTIPDSKEELMAMHEEIEKKNNELERINTMKRNVMDQFRETMLEKKIDILLEPKYYETVNSARIKHDWMRDEYEEAKKQIKKEGKHMLEGHEHMIIWPKVVENIKLAGVTTNINMANVPSTTENKKLENGIKEGEMHKAWIENTKWFILHGEELKEPFRTTVRERFIKKWKKEHPEDDEKIWEPIS